MNQVTRIEPNRSAVTRLRDTGWTDSQLRTMQQTVARDTNGLEFDLFIEYARTKGLDPFSRQVIAVIYNKHDDKKRAMTIITTQDGLRVMASRCGDYRPEETEADYEYDETLKSPINPLGLVKASIKLWKQDNAGTWHPVSGTAYWDEYAPIKISDNAFEYIDTGEMWPDTGKPKKRKQLKASGGPASKVLDDSGMWGKMPRNQLAKCARMQALRGGWPETFSGVYGEEEMDRHTAADRTASELAEMALENERSRLIGEGKGEIPYVDENGILTFIPGGRYGDKALEFVGSCSELQEYSDFKIRNREGLVRYWAHHRVDASEVKKKMEQFEAALRAKPKPVVKIETNEQRPAPGDTGKSRTRFD